MEGSSEMHMNYEWIQGVNWYISWTWTSPPVTKLCIPRPHKLIQYESYNTIIKKNAQCLKVIIFITLFLKKGNSAKLIVLINLWRVQSSELRKRRNTCSVQLFRQFGSSRVTAASSGLLSPSEDVWTHQHATAGHGRGLWNFGLFIVDLVSAVGYNRCLVWTNTIILHHAAMLTRVLRGFFPFKWANTNNHWLAPVGCSPKPTWGRA